MGTNPNIATSAAETAAETAARVIKTTPEELAARNQIIAGDLKVIQDTHQAALKILERTARGECTMAGGCTSFEIIGFPYGKAPKISSDEQAQALVAELQPVRIVQIERDGYSRG